MKNLMKGMIVFFGVIIVLLVGFLIYGVSNGGYGGWGLSDDPVSGGKLIHTQELSLEGIGEILINARNSDVIFKETDDTQITLKEYGTKQYKESFMDVDTNGKLLALTADRDRTSWFSFGNHYRYIEIYLPRSYQDAMTVQTSSGDIIADYALTFSLFSAECSSGATLLHSVHAENISFAASSGDIKLDNELVSSTLKAETSSGAILLNTVSADEIELGASSGDIRVEESTGTLDAETSSGYISIEDIDGSGTFEASSGDISLSFTKLTDDLTLDTSSGTVKCSLPADSGFDFNANTNSGDIRTYFDDDLSYDKDGENARGKVGQNSEYKIDVNTSSGDIRFLED